jgi:hypothetical protein
MINLGCVLETQGDHASAEETYTQAIAALVTVHGEDHQDIAAALSNLACLYQVRRSLPRTLPCVLSIERVHTCGTPVSFGECWAPCLSMPPNPGPPPFC